ISRPPGPSWSGPWRSTRRRWASDTPSPPPVWPTSAGCSRTNAILAMTQSFRWFRDAFLSLASQARLAPEESYRPILASKGAVCRRQHRLRAQRRRGPAGAPARLPGGRSPVGRGQLVEDRRRADPGANGPVLREPLAPEPAAGRGLAGGAVVDAPRRAVARRGRDQ